MARPNYQLWLSDGRDFKIATTPWAQILVERDEQARALRDGGQWEEWALRVLHQQAILDGAIEDCPFDTFGPLVVNQEVIDTDVVPTRTTRSRRDSSDSA